LKYLILNFDEVIRVILLSISLARSDIKPWTIGGLYFKELISDPGNSLITSNASVTDGQYVNRSYLKTVF
jgi:hypothetical protein